MNQFFGVPLQDVNSVKNGEDLKWYLKGIFDAAENQYGQRINEEEKSKWYERYLKKVDEMWERKKRGLSGLELEETEKLFHLVKGNLLLRKGQNQDELFTSSRETYQEALKYLRRHIKQEAEEPDTVDLLIQLSLGKYFRNLAHREKRSNYYMALHEFEKVEQWVKAGKGEGGRMRTQIWLDVRVNTGRAYKNLYNLKQARIIFLEIVYGIGNRAGYAAAEAVHQLKESHVIWEQKSENNELYAQMQGNEFIWLSYMIQALVQLAIVYRKEKKYTFAREICHAVEKMSHDNVDVINNLGVCDRKEEKYEAAKSAFAPLMKQKNRFAEINYWKCILKENEIRNTYEISGEDEKILEDFLERGKADKEIQILKGRFYQQQGELEKAYEVFSRLYEEYPYIKMGTTGLKAYYNMAKCLMMQGRFQQAARILEEIKAICPKDHLARIDFAWCMMNMNRYQDAKKEYECLIKVEYDSSMPDVIVSWDIPENWLQFEKMKVKNNLGECYLRTGNIDNAKKLFQDVLTQEEGNIEALGFMAQCHILKGEESRKNGDYERAVQEYERVIEDLNKVWELERLRDDGRKNIQKRDIQSLSKLIVAKGELLQILAAQKGRKGPEYTEKAEEYKTYIEESLLYYPDIFYMQKACYEMAGFLKELGFKEEDDILYRAFSHIRLWEREEGFKAFSHYMKSQNFLCLNAVERGKILVYLFLIYGSVIRIKEECRYSPEASETEEMVPRHYTTVNTLKLLLGDGTDGEKQAEKKENMSRLRLWNSVYMNDPYEGVCFLDLMGHKADKTGQKILSEYFPHLKNSTENLAPINGNVYITSMTRQEDDWLMWMTYGNRAEGCSIVFADDFFDIRSKIDGPMGYPVYADEDYPLYEVQYIDANAARKGRLVIVNYNASTKARAEEKAERIQKSMEDILENIQALEQYMKEVFEAEGAKSGTDALRGFVADALNEVRFLFKYDEYSQEREMRMVSYSYEPKLDGKFDVPRMYTEVERDIRIKEVMLGAKISQEKTDEIVSWLYTTGKVEKVRKSVKHFK